MLHGGCTRNGIVGICEHDESAVTLTTRPYKYAAVGYNSLVDRFIVLAQRLQHHIGRLFEHTGAAHYICEKKCQHTFRELLYHIENIRNVYD
jgi:hypothetical protein